jgi:hypothetical protein
MLGNQAIVAPCLTAVSAGIGYGAGWAIGKATTKADAVKYGLVGAISLAMQTVMTYGVSQSNLTDSKKIIATEVGDAAVRAVTACALFTLGPVGVYLGAILMVSAVDKLAKQVINVTVDHFAINNNWKPFNSHLIKSYSINTVRIGFVALSAPLTLIPIVILTDGLFRF